MDTLYKIVPQHIIIILSALAILSFRLLLLTYMYSVK